MTGPRPIVRCRLWKGQSGVVYSSDGIAPTTEDNHSSNYVEVDTKMTDPKDLEMERRETTERKLSRRRRR